MYTCCIFTLYNRYRHRLLLDCETSDWVWSNRKMSSSTWWTLVTRESDELGWCLVADSDWGVVGICRLWSSILETAEPMTPAFDFRELVVFYQGETNKLFETGFVLQRTTADDNSHERKQIWLFTQLTHIEKSEMILGHVHSFVPGVKDCLQSPLAVVSNLCCTFRMKNNIICSPLLLIDYWFWCEATESFWKYSAKAKCVKAACKCGRAGVWYIQFQWVKFYSTGDERRWVHFCYVCLLIYCLTCFFFTILSSRFYCFMNVFPNLLHVPSSLSLLWVILCMWYVEHDILITHQFSCHLTFISILLPVHSFTLPWWRTRAYLFFTCTFTFACMATK